MNEATDAKPRPALAIEADRSCGYPQPFKACIGNGVDASSATAAVVLRREPVMASRVRSVAAVSAGLVSNVVLRVSLGLALGAAGLLPPS